MNSTSSYRNNFRDISDSGSSSDSDAECDVWKRSSKKREHSGSSVNMSECAAEPLHNSASISTPSSVVPAATPISAADISGKRARKANTIWADVITEATVSEDLGQIGLTKMPESDRNCETYDYTRSALDTRPLPVLEQNMDSDGFSHDDEENDDENVVPETEDVSPSHSKEVLRRKINQVPDDQKQEFKRLSREDFQVARRIAWKLGEPKKYLICRIVDTLGPEKALELLKRTEEIEEQGGMLIKSNNRRRTPGGVYLTLLKEDASIAKEKKDTIFAGEKISFAYHIMMRKIKAASGERPKRKSKKKKQKNKRKSHSSTDDKDSKLEVTEMELAEEETPSTAPKVESPQQETGDNVADAKNVESDASDIEDGEILD